jgi:two-component system response regulator HydG
MQAKLVRALLEKQVRPVGASQPVPFSSRILAASSRDLIAAVEQGQFRKDLYFRLNVVKLAIPPLRERREDIPMLAQHFLENVQRQRGISLRFSDACLRLLCNYDWPGNVRELQSAIERTCAMSSGPVLHTVDLPTQLQDFQAHLRSGTGTGTAAYDDRPHPIIPIADMEKHAILSTIQQLNGDKLMAAKLLGIGKTTLYRKLKEYGEDC